MYEQHFLTCPQSSPETINFNAKKKSVLPSQNAISHNGYSGVIDNQIIQSRSNITFDDLRDSARLNTKKRESYTSKLTMHTHTYTERECMGKRVRRMEMGNREKKPYC